MRKTGAKRSRSFIPVQTRSTKTLSTRFPLFPLIMTFANFASGVKLYEISHTPPPTPCWFCANVSKRDEAQTEFARGTDLLTLINEQFKPDFIRIWGTSACPPHVGRHKLTVSSNFLDYQYRRLLGMAKGSEGQKCCTHRRRKLWINCACSPGKFGSDGEKNVKILWMQKEKKKERVKTGHSCCHSLQYNPTISSATRPPQCPLC